MNSFETNKQYKTESIEDSNLQQPIKHYMNLDLILDFDYIDDEDDLYDEFAEREYYSSEEIDDRLYQSGVEDIEGGDNFADYARYFFNTYGEDLFDN